MFLHLPGRYSGSLDVFFSVISICSSQNLHPVYNELRNNSPARLDAVIGISIGSAAIIYEIIGMLGYMTFGNKVKANIMEMYNNSAGVNICRLAILMYVLPYLHCCPF